MFINSSQIFNLIIHRLIFSTLLKTCHYTGLEMERQNTIYSICIVPALKLYANDNTEKKGM